MSEDGESTSDSSLEADFGDSSTLSITAISATELQVDIIAEGVSVSFTDTYSFEAREDFPGVYE